jgi:hypothetical protein
MIASSLLLIGCPRGAAVQRVDPNGPVEVVIPEHGAYAGAFMDFGDAEDAVTLETIEDFVKAWRTLIGSGFDPASDSENMMETARPRAAGT